MDGSGDFSQMCVEDEYIYIYISIYIYVHIHRCNIVDVSGG